MYLNIKTEYSFRHVFAPVDKIIEKVKKIDMSFAGVADLNNTFAFVPWEKACLKHAIKPIFGVVLNIVPDLEIKDRRGVSDETTFIANDQAGLREIYKLVETAYKQFWYTPRLSFEDVSKISGHVTIIANNINTVSLVENQLADYYRVSPAPGIDRSNELKPIAMIENNYIDESDKATYETFADQRTIDRATYIQHIPRYGEFCRGLGVIAHRALNNLQDLANEIEHIKLEKAPLVKYSTTGNPLKIREKIIYICNDGAMKVGVDLHKKKYQKRLKYEIDLIIEKGFADYFLIVADLVKEAKRKMLVGPGRGSSGGSLVCYLLGITNLDPIKRGLIFERFIDINRTDLPDIDIDFEDRKRVMVLKYLARKYNVAQIANISTMTPKANLNRVAKALHVPEHDLTELKTLTSDTKADAEKVKRLLEETEPGQAILVEYPEMVDCIALEDHALHSSIHAAGILVSNEPITNFTSIINSRKADENNNPIACLDMSGVEYLNMLKIDALGLKTLSVLAETLEQVNKPFDFLYNLPDGDKKTYKLINSGRLTGIFQLEGRAIRGLLKKVTMGEIADLSAISALGRPGPMKARSTDHYLKRKAGKEKVTFPDKGLKKILSETFGVIVYQESIMFIARQYAGMDWPDIIKLRKVIGKSKGEEIQDFREKFLKGAKKNGRKKAVKVWEQLETFGAYGFNKSHSVAYAFITYWCAYCKANFPLEFAVGLLNNTDDDEKKIHILRFMAEEEGIKHKDFITNHSGLKWRVHGGKLLGPLDSIHGIGLAGARKIVALRKTGGPIPAGIQKHLDNGISAFTYIYPRTQLYKRYKGLDIKTLSTNEEKVLIVGRIMAMKLKDANALDKVKARGKAVSGPTTYLNLIIADDTGEIMVIINRFEYQEIGKEFAETAELKKTWVQIRGEYNPDMGLFFADKIKNITRV